MIQNNKGFQQIKLWSFPLSISAGRRCTYWDLLERYVAIHMVQREAPKSLIVCFMNESEDLI